MTSVSRLAFSARVITNTYQRPIIGTDRAILSSMLGANTVGSLAMGAKIVYVYAMGTIAKAVRS